MTMKKITVTIESDESVILRVERFLSWLHFCSHWGHSGIVAMPCDGDGCEKVTVTGIDVEGHRKTIQVLSSSHPKKMLVECVNSAKVQP